MCCNMPVVFSVVEFIDSVGVSSACWQPVTICAKSIRIKDTLDCFLILLHVVLEFVREYNVHFEISFHYKTSDFFEAR